ncbi:tRNA uridine-5-carboxymethylaminomethyl(34) synthesis GTPase MnmE [Chelatococcus sambhunathii]|uniref:tRNA uridine-5-carboxymethylaminomethyl(34) synthesis GTPase MnmE n=1 Tax=Chelatococcus sambhunathii TaxID=363953 RepID=UPI0006E41991|nr:tRNA uridine-5-carboxymethylaminomethyl(34) synthesis GTPase MnmE [Chelatococcus sambhunathii]
MQISRNDTIFALASGAGRAGIAVVRLSGPACRFVLELMAGHVPRPRRLELCRLRHPLSRDLLDEALVAFFPSPNSFTGEDVAELHVHGGRAVIGAVIAGLGEISGCRLAGPGEFSRRALLNGKMDLSAIEGLGDLIDAETEMQRRQAMRQMRGELRDAVERWRTTLIEASAFVEAELDFADESDVPDGLRERAMALLVSVADELRREIARARSGERIRSGLTVVIAGPPNAGKSTLLNALAQRDVAIVSDIPGTTRDSIEVHWDLAGIPVTLVDTAGLRESRDPIEQEGVRRARDRARNADVILSLRAFDSQTEHLQDAPGAVIIPIRTKIDLATGRGVGSDASLDELELSAATGEGVEALVARLETMAKNVVADGGLVTRARHREAFAGALATLERAISAGPGHPGELFAEDIRLAMRYLGRVTGRVDVEDVLDRLFAGFCIGK